MDYLLVKLNRFLSLLSGATVENGRDEVDLACQDLAQEPPSKSMT